MVGLSGAIVGAFRNVVDRGVLWTHFMDPCGLLSSCGLLSVAQAVTEGGCVCVCVRSLLPGTTFLVKYIDIYTLEYKSIYIILRVYYIQDKVS